VVRFAFDPPDRRARAGFTLTELVVVAAIIVVLLALLFTAIQKVRWASARIACCNNLKKLGMAARHCNDFQDRLPPQAGTFAGAHDAPLFFHLLPYVEQGGTWRMARFFDKNAEVGTTSPAFRSTIRTRVLRPTWASVNINNMTYLRQTRISVYQCPGDPSLNHALDWQGGDSSYAGNFQVFGGQVNTDSSADWDGQSRIPNTFADGTSNTILFAEKYARCDGTSGPAGTWWMRGVYHGGHPSTPDRIDDSFPGDRFSAVFAGGRGVDGTAWLTGSMSKFQVRPGDYLQNPGPCDAHVASSGHANGMNVCLADGSVRYLDRGIDSATWWALCTPAGHDELPADW
jgi:prepilin-type N-terminal cleavage/methylation domain-containing protein/prepilin-type processing-associated H-X9-DG protein